jgi:hypothetical protein
MELNDGDRVKTLKPISWVAGSVPGDIQGTIHTFQWGIFKDQTMKEIIFDNPRCIQNKNKNFHFGITTLDTKLIERVL